MSVADMKKGERAVFVGMHGGWGMRKRLEAMGVYPGVVLTKVSGHLFGGPVIIRIGRMQLAVGRGMAHRIIVHRVGGME
jgi:ferrous iron transport protein A